LWEFADGVLGVLIRVNGLKARKDEALAERANCVIALRSEGVSLLLDISGGQLPAIVHWGAGLGALELADAQALILSNIDPGGANVVDQPIRLAILPEHWTGWVGRPGLSGSRAGRAWSPKFTATEVRLDGKPVTATDSPATMINAGLASVEVEAVDEAARAPATHHH
jgi:alpha-galactosidase